MNDVNERKTAKREPTQPWATKMFSAENTRTYPSAMPALERLQIGDTVQQDKGPVIIIRVSESGAVGRRLSKTEVTRTVRAKTANQEDKEVTFNAMDYREHRLSATVPRFLILERGGPKAVEEFLKPTERPQGVQKQQTTNEEGNMSKKTKKSAKGKAAKKNTGERKAREGGLGLLLGHSVASVVRRCGVEGVKCGHMMAILAAKGIKASKPGVQTMLFNGRHGIGGDPAPITATEVKELIASAPEPQRANAAKEEAPKAKAD